LEKGWILIFSKGQGTPVPTNLIETFIILQRNASGTVFALRGIDSKSFLPLFFSKKRAGIGAAPHTAKHPIGHCVRAKRNRIKSFWAYLFSKR